MSDPPSLPPSPGSPENGPGERGRWSERAALSAESVAGVGVTRDAGVVGAGRDEGEVRVGGTGTEVPVPRGGVGGGASGGGAWSILLSRPGVWLGGLWLLVVSVAGVFAPFLASSHPWRVVMSDGSVRWPLLEHLTAVDVALPVIVGLGLVAWWVGGVARRVRDAAAKAGAGGGSVAGPTFGERGLLGRVKPWQVWAGWFLVSVVVGVGSWWLVEPPALTVYERYRVMLAEGEAVSATHTLVPYSPSDRFRDMPERSLELPLAPGATHWMGTDRNGADLLSRMIHASRVALAVGFIATGIALIIGVTLGGLMGYFVGIVDLIGMRIVEVASAIPVLFLLLTFVAVFDRNLYLMMVIIGVTGWVGYARFVRAEFFKLRAMDFVAAARACGLPLWSILFRHMLPNAIAPVLVAASFGIPSAILYEATLSFIGLGLVDEPSWGQMLSQATGSGGGFYWWIAAFPGMAIFLTVFGFNLIGEALRDVVDVKT